MSECRVGIVGAGPMGRLHAQTVARVSERDGTCVLTTVVDHHPERAQAVADEFGAAVASDHASALDDADVVVVCVPTSAHFEMAESLLRHGHDILVEKPLAATVVEARRLQTLARSEGRILQVGHVEWYNRGWREAARLAGAPRKIEVDRLHPRSERGLDIDVVQDFMLHDLDWVTRLLAEDIVKLEAWGRCVVHDKLDEAEAQLRFRSGCEVRLRASRVFGERRRKVRIEGDDAAVAADLLLRRVEGADPEADGLPDPLEMQWAEFLDCVRTRKNPESDAAVGVAALEVVDRVRASIVEHSGSAARDDDPSFGR